MKCYYIMYVLQKKCVSVSSTFFILVINKGLVCDFNWHQHDVLINCVINRTCFPAQWWVGIQNQGRKVVVVCNIWISRRFSIHVE